MKVVFMGTPLFAVPTLKAILDAGYEVVGVVTATDKWIGRGKKTLSKSPVKVFAEEHGLKIMQPPNLKADTFVEELKSCKADIQVVVAFRMLPRAVWDMPPLGTYNLHGSLLPAYRGAAPIHWAVARGEAFTGLTTFKLKHEIDTGTLAFQDVCMIPTNATTGDMHDRMMYTGASLMVKTLKAIENNSITFNVQDESRVSHAPKVYHEESEIRPELPSDEVRHLIHGMSPFPGAWLNFHGKKLKVYRVRSYKGMVDINVGDIVRCDGKAVLMCKDGGLELVKVQPSGKPKMSGEQFANGYL
jgi:methionyl-tRNA formyltransferase